MNKFLEFVEVIGPFSFRFRSTQRTLLERLVAQGCLVAFLLNVIAVADRNFSHRQSSTSKENCKLLKGCAGCEDESGKAIVAAIIATTHALERPDFGAFDAVAIPRFVLPLPVAIPTLGGRAPPSMFAA